MSIFPRSGDGEDRDEPDSGAGGDINIAITKKWVSAQCAGGYKLDFRTYAGRSHMGVLDADSALTPQLIAWTADRFDGKPAPNTC